MRVFTWLLTALFVGFLLLVVATLEATDRSRERTTCYKHLLASGEGSVDDCPIPAEWENKLKEFLL